MLKSYRFYYSMASYFLLVAAAGHSVGHYLSFINRGGFSEERLSVARTMQGYVADELLGGSLWTILQMFSAAFFWSPTR